MNPTTTVNRDRARANRVTAVITTMCALGCASAAVPVVEHTITAILLVLATLALAAAVGRLVARRVRERREDRADLLIAAAWRAEHAPHLLTPACAAAVRPALASARGVA